MLILQLYVTTHIQFQIKNGHQQVYHKMLLMVLHKMQDLT